MRTVRQLLETQTPDVYSVAPEDSVISAIKLMAEECLLEAADVAVEAWAREGTNKAANRFNQFELRPADEDRLAPAGEVDGPPGADGVRRTKTGWRRVLSRKRDDDESSQ